MIAVSPLAADTVKRVRCVLGRDPETVISNVPPRPSSDQHVAKLVGHFCLVALPTGRSALLLRLAADPEQELDLGLLPPVTRPLVRASSSLVDCVTPAGTSLPDECSSRLAPRFGWSKRSRH